MRRKNEETNDGGTGRVKFRVIEFEIGGDNSTLAEGIRALTTALSKTSGPTVETRQRPVLAPPAPNRTTAAAETPVPVEGELFPEPEEENDEEAAEGSNGNGATPTKPKKPAQPPRTPDILSDIDLNSGKVSLQDYVAQKSPNGPFETYATMAAWYKENHNLEEVNDDRIYTAYRFLDIVPPNDVAGVLRKLKFQKWFDKGSSKGASKINIVGLNKVHGNFK